MWRRPSRTCPTTNHDTGATCEYHGQSVRFEWQSPQERVNIEWTPGGTSIMDSMVWLGVNGGLVRAGRQNCAPANASAMKTETKKRTLRIFVNSNVYPKNLCRAPGYRGFLARPSEGHQNISNDPRVTDHMPPRSFRTTSRVIQTCDTVRRRGGCMRALAVFVLSDRKSVV